MSRLIAALLLCSFLQPASGRDRVPTDTLSTGIDSLRTGEAEIGYLPGPATASAPRPLWSTQSGPKDATWLRPVPEVLAELTGTVVPEANRSTGVPLLRGLNAKRLVVLFDGVPLGHSAQRDGPSMSPIGMLPPSVIGKVDVVRGPAGIDRASGGLAGVVDLGNILDRATGESNRPFGGLAASQQFASADGGWTGRLSFGGEYGRFRFHVAGAGRILGDLRAGSVSSSAPASSVEPYTNMRESTILASALYQVSRSIQVRSAYLTGQRSRRIELGRFEQLAVTPPVELTIYDPRRFSLGMASVRLSDLGRLNTVSLTMWHGVQEDERTFRKPMWTKTLFDDDRVTSGGVSGAVNLKATSRHELTVGIDLRAERVDAGRKEVRDEGITFYQRGRFPGGTTSRAAGFFAEDTWSPNERIRVSSSLRYSIQRVHAHYGPSVFGTSGVIGLVDRTYAGLSFRSGITMATISESIVSASISRGFRAPSLDDALANSEWQLGRDVPNPDVRPEYATQFEVAFKRDEGAHDRSRLSIFHTLYQDLIKRTWFDAGPDGIPATVDDLFRFENENRATVTGAELEISRPVYSTNSLGVWLNCYMTAQFVSIDMPDYVPPAVVRAGIRIDGGRAWIEPFVRVASKTPAVSYQFVDDRHRDSPPWATFNFRGGVSLTSELRALLAYENVGDLRYREHGAHIASPGRNLVFGLSYGL